jgi:hypothetical protein
MTTMARSRHGVCQESQLQGQRSPDMGHQGLWKVPCGQILELEVIRRTDTKLRRNVGYVRYMC